MKTDLFIVVACIPEHFELGFSNFLLSRFDLESKGEKEGGLEENSKCIGVIATILVPFCPCFQ